MNIHFISLGCDKNLVDSEQMTALLAERGFSFTDDPEEADIIVVNTCCFIGDAKEESINTILEAAELKESGRLKCLVASGCLAERYAEEIRTEIPEVDAIVGTTAFDRIVEAVEKAMEKALEREKKAGAEDPGTEKALVIREAKDRLPDASGHRSLSTGGHYEYLKIAEGCDKHCTYCIIPKARGPYRSIPMEKLLAEAEYLAEQGVKELILVAQETTIYGKDLYGRKALPELLSKLCEIEGLRWIRILYCYPEEIDENLIRVMREQPKICRYLDLPVQHASDRILKRMGRRTTKAEIRKIVELLRKEIPDICLRTTLISGFPGETEEEHQELLSFIRELRFDRLGDFTYSREEGTAAAEFPDQIPEEVKIRRRDEVMEAQQEIAFEKAAAQTGKILEVLIEGRIPEEGTYVGRTSRDCPGVDGYIFLPEEGAGRTLMTGDFIEAEVTGANAYDLLGRILSGDKGRN